MGETSIEWTDRTWNPVRGCWRVSEGCRNCYAERQAARFCRSIDDIPGPSVGQTHDAFHGFVQITKAGPRWTGKVELIESKLTEPLHWRKPQRVFVNSVSDLFHEALPDEAIDRVFAVMALCPQHTFQVLTKRPKRMLEWFRGDGRDRWEDHVYNRAYAISAVHGGTPGARWPLPNVWLGVSVEDQKTADERIPLLLQTPAAKRFVSYEPPLGPVDFTRWLACEGHLARTFHNVFLDWIIVGGESGPGARPFDIAWARSTIAQCKAAGVACFVKQFGARPGYQRKDGWRDMELRDRKGGDPSEWPEWARVRQFPEVRA